VLRYSSGGYTGQGTTGALYRVDYTGTYDPSCAPVSLAENFKRGDVRLGALMSDFHSVHLPAHIKGFEAYDLSGRKVWTYSRKGETGSMQVPFPAHLNKGLLQVRYL
jgi:hypothetical protein